MYKYKRYIIVVSFLFLIMFTFGYVINSLLNSSVKKVESKAISATDTSSNGDTVVEAYTQSKNTAQNTENPQNVSAPKKPEVIKYAVKQGDTLESIANTYKITVDSITESNGISKNETLKIGQELIFPSVSGVVYKVQDGDTLWDISSLYSMDIASITGTNDGLTPDSLKIGQQIILPGGDKVKVVDSRKIDSSSSNIKIASRSSSTVSSKPSIIGMWPVNGAVTSWFGSRWGTLHKGIDIGAPKGTDVHAFADGTVIFSGWDNGGYGNLVIISHGNGLETYYAHNSKLLVSAGQEVTKGQRIALVGSTGDSTGSHCHFEVRKNGVPNNPANYLN